MKEVYLMNWASSIIEVARFIKNNMSDIWSCVAAIAASISALLSLIGMIVNVHYNRKTYRANLEIKSKLDLLNEARKLVPEFLSEVKYASHLYMKASANSNDRKVDKENRLSPGVFYSDIDFSDYYNQLYKAQNSYYELKNMLKLLDYKDLTKNVEDIWKHFNQVKSCCSDATNAYESNEEKEYNNRNEELSQKLLDDFSTEYTENVKNLIKQ